MPNLKPINPSTADAATAASLAAVKAKLGVVPNMILTLANTPVALNGYLQLSAATAGGKLNASYLLSSPNWDALTNGRWSAHTKTFQLRVTLAIGAAERTVDKQSITPAMLEPPVPT